MIFPPLKKPEKYIVPHKNDISLRLFPFRVTSFPSDQLVKHNTTEPKKAFYEWNNSLPKVFQKIQKRNWKQFRLEQKDEIKEKRMKYDLI